MPEIRNCRRCGKVFNSVNNIKICRECEVKAEEEFKLVKDYLYRNPGATITEIVNELDVSVEKIKGYLRAERIEIVNSDGNCFLECERCSVAITTGRLCKECSAEMASDLMDAAGEVELKISRDNADKDIKMRHLK